MAYVNTLNVSGTDYMLQDKEAVKWDLVWTNASPTSSMGAATLSLDLNDYDMVVLLYFESAPNSLRRNILSIIIPIGNWSSLSTLSSAVNEVSTQRAVVELSRKCTVNSDSVVFSAGYYKTIDAGSYAYQGGNDVCVPYKIYGIKLGD